MCLNLRDYQLKIIIYLYMCITHIYIHMNFTVITNQKLITDKHKKEWSSSITQS